MGTDTACKTETANMIARGLDAKVKETSKAGVRTFSRINDPEYPIVVDTLPFQSVYYEDLNRWKCARKWISKNSLRRLFGRRVFLVGVVNSTTPMDYFPDETSPYSRVNWLPLLAYMWKEFKELKIFLVNKDSFSIECQEKRESWRDTLVQEGIDASDIVLANLSWRGIPVPDSRLPDARRIMKPFLFKEVTRTDNSPHSFGAWGPESVILFGRSGSGKSTLAQMLVSGKLDSEARNSFTISSGIRGGTTKVVRGQGRGWYVVDTPGFGEPRDELSSTSTSLAEKRIKQYVQIIEGTYSHYLYVVKKDRIDQLEQKLWQFFCLLFGDELKFFFTVVVSDADEEWVTENRTYLATIFEGCESFVGAEFPPIKSDDEEWETENRKTRGESLKALEDELSSRERYDVFCYFGRFSSITATGEVASITSRTVKSLSKKFTNKVLAAVLWVYSDFRRLMNLLMHDNRVVLEPLIDDDDVGEMLHHHRDE